MSEPSDLAAGGRGGATPRARCLAPRVSAENGLQSSCLQPPEESFQLVGQAAPEASDVLLGPPTQHHIKMAL